MGRAKLSSVVARKATTCIECNKTIAVGETKWVVTAYRMRRNYCSEHKPSEDRIRTMGGQSRSDRASAAATDWDLVTDQLRELGQSASDATKQGVEEMSETVREIRAALANLSIDTSEVESLAEEMGSWRDNMEEHFGATSKYEEVSECAESLEQLDSLPDLPELTDNPTTEDLESFASECEDAASELDDKARELESIDFPGMY